MDGDIKKAYDYASHTMFASAARSRGMHEVLINAWLREWRTMRSVFKLDSQNSIDEVERTQSLPQGDPAAPMIFNLILDTLASRFAKIAEENEWGFRLLDGTWIYLVTFADNYWLMATSPSMLRNMTSAWLALLAEYGWETPTAELTWCTTWDDGNYARIEIAGEVVHRAAVKDGFKVLGTIVAFDGYFNLELENILSRANRAFSASWELLGCATVPITQEYMCSDL